jgi:hypothetical protein
MDRSLTAIAQLSSSHQQHRGQGGGEMEARHPLRHDKLGLAPRYGGI